MMTIGQFSERTGLPPKTLRYYQDVQLLVPTVRLANGYRQYADVQVEKARLISSLRQAGLRVAAIREFLASDQARKAELLSRWREEAATKLLSIQVANQFLNGLESQTTRVHLTCWDQPRYMIWFATHVVKHAEEWQIAAQTYESQLMQTGLEVEPSIYLRFDDGEASRHGEMGFVSQARTAPTGQTAELYSPALFASLECDASMPMPCKAIFSAVRRFGFRPVGIPLRRYPDRSALAKGRYVLMLPVVQF